MTINEIFNVITEIIKITLLITIAQNQVKAFYYGDK